MMFKDENGMEYSIQYYQKKHKNEYLIKNGLGDCYLYENGLLKMIWKEDVDGNRMGEFVSFDKGRISFIQNFDNLLNGDERIRIVNDKRGECMEMWKGDKVVYLGEYNDLYEREGVGIVYDPSTSKELLEGVFKNNELKVILKVFEGNEMIEYYDNGNNIDMINKIPIYVGGYIVDENDGLFKRNGLGYLIDVDKRIATRECIYENGVESKGIDLIDGWYHKNSNHSIQIQKYPIELSYKLTINNSNELKSMNVNIENLIISSNSCNDLNSLNLNENRYLKSIEIRNNCFSNVDLFKIDGLKSLKSLKIGKNSFTHLKSNDRWDYDKANNPSQSFSILNCIELESIEIGEFSFSDYGGGFELLNLPKLSIIKIGYVGSYSFNFCFSSLEIKGIIDMILLMNRSSSFEFHQTWL